jgi:hypothetical protein
LRFEWPNHQETAMHQTKGTTMPEPLPEPGRRKKSPPELEKLLDKGIEDSMAASDPPAATQPEVHTEPGRPVVKPLPAGGKRSPKRKK